jgi:RNA recognition motif-containing protein
MCGLWEAIEKKKESCLTPSFPSERVDISIDPFTGRNPSYCFVELESKEQADRAMVELDGKDLLGRPVKVKPGVAKASQDRSSPRPSNNTNIAPRSTEKPGSSSVAFDRWQRNDASSHFKGYSENGRRLYVGGLPKLSNQQTIDSEIQTLFNGYNMYVFSQKYRARQTLPNTNPDSSARLSAN